MTSARAFSKYFNFLLSEDSRKKSERIVLNVAIFSFIVHLFLILLTDFGILYSGNENELLSSPIAAIYTPFSFILIYEVYLLIFYLPKSFTTYIGKQYEIIVLIIIRRLFKDFSSLSLTTDWFKIKYDLQFTYDLIASLILFYLIYLFRKEGAKRFVPEVLSHAEAEGVERFIKIKKTIASLLIPLIFVVSVYSFLNWLWITLGTHQGGGSAFRNINNVFFEHFFTILIVVDVVLLLFSFFHTDEFHKIIRNSGFIISTILIRLSFSVEGLLNTLLIVAAIVFGLLMLVIYNKYESRVVRNTALDAVTEES
jgi:hypothetical protein